ncbi:TPA: ArsR family transcriptional regulator [Candidatus Poribacteria bacterium]|nr:ArsR family transcriptional regulator [Candidatus Poribacteria bacterium]
MQEIVNVFKALSDPTRLRILLLLQHGELCVCEVEEVLGMKQSRISRHLNILRNAGLTEARYFGRWVFYSLANPKTNRYHRRVIDTLVKWAQDSDQVFLDRKKLEACTQKRGQEGHCPIPET